MRTFVVCTLAFAVALLTPGEAVGETGIALQKNKFVPREVTVRVGETVVWTNMDSIGHTVTADGGSFDSHPTCGMVGGSCMMKDQTYRQTFTKAGTVPYHCKVHGSPGSGMAGTVTVTG